MTGLIGCATLDSSDVYCWGRFVEFSGTLEIARDVGLVGELVRFARGAVRFGGGAAGTTCLAEESGNWWCQGSCKNLPSLGLPCSGLGQGIAWSSIQNTSPFEQLALGVVSGCGLDASGSLHCWSSDGSVGAGDGNLRRTNVPVPIRFGERVLQVAAGGFQGSLTTNEPERSSTCFITASRRLYCWGNGVLGDRSTVLYVPTRVVLSGGD